MIVEGFKKFFFLHAIKKINNNRKHDDATAVAGQ